MTISFSKKSILSNNNNSPGIFSPSRYFQLFLGYRSVMQTGFEFCLKIFITLTGTFSPHAFIVTLKHIRNKSIIISVLSICPLSLYHKFIPMSSNSPFLTNFPCSHFVHHFSTLNLEWLSTPNKKKSKLFTMALKALHSSASTYFSNLISPAYLGSNHSELPDVPLR